MWDRKQKAVIKEPVYLRATVSVSLSTAVCVLSKTLHTEIIPIFPIVILGPQEYFCEFPYCRNAAGIALIDIFVFHYMTSIPRKQICTIYFLEILLFSWRWIVGMFKL